MNWQIIIKFSPNKNSDKSFSTSSFDPRKFDSKFTARTQAFTHEELTDYYQIFAKSKSRRIIQFFKLQATLIKEEASEARRQTIERLQYNSEIVVY